MSLSDGNVLYFEMEEATSADRVDQIAGLILTQVNGVAQITGEHNFGAGFTGAFLPANAQYMHRTTDPRFSVNTSHDGFTVGFWIKAVDPFASSSLVLRKGSTIGGPTGLE